MDEAVHAFRNSNLNSNSNETFLVKRTDDPKYFYVAIASLIVFLLISIITTVLLCVTLKNEPILWEADVEKPPEPSGTADEVADSFEEHERECEDENNV